VRPSQVDNGAAVDAIVNDYAMMSPSVRMVHPAEKINKRSCTCIAWKDATLKLDRAHVNESCD